MKRVLPIVTSIAGFCLYCLGIWTGAILPAEFWAYERRAANAAIGHLPNMDPGTVVYLSAFVVLPFASAVLLVEVVRAFRAGGPVLPPSAYLLGFIVSAPVGFAITGVFPVVGWLAQSATIACGVSAFYGVRRWHIKKHCSAAPLPNYAFERTAGRGDRVS